MVCSRVDRSYLLTFYSKTATVSNIPTDAVDPNNRIPLCAACMLWSTKFASPESFGSTPICDGLLPTKRYSEADMASRVLMRYGNGVLSSSSQPAILLGHHFAGKQSGVTKQPCRFRILDRTPIRFKLALKE